MIYVPQIVTDAVVERGIEYKGKQDKARKKHNAKIGAVAVGEKAHFRTRRHWTSKISSLQSLSYAYLETLAC